ncbi:MAG: hypothetical protein IJS60_02155 [Abditibacteriota bacterium]|nr:hypothetical protein [Abditibacteriota bacterium]
MRDYYVSIEEYIGKKFGPVEARSIEEAKEIAIQKYKECEFVLDGDSTVFERKIAVYISKDNTTDYEEF